MLPALATSFSSVLGGGLSGPGGAKGSADTVTVDTGPVTQTTGGGPMFEATDSWIWLVVLAVMAVALFKWR